MLHSSGLKSWHHFNFQFSDLFLNAVSKSRLGGGLLAVCLLLLSTLVLVRVECSNTEQQRSKRHCFTMKQCESFITSIVISTVSVDSWPQHGTCLIKFVHGISNFCILSPSCHW